MNFKEFIEGAGDQTLSTAGDLDNRGLFREPAIFKPVKDSKSRFSKYLDKKFKGKPNNNK